MKKNLILAFFFPAFLTSCGGSSLSTNLTSNTLTTSNEGTTKITETTSIEYNQTTYTNPLIPYNADFKGYYKAEIADPSIVKGDDGYYYIFATEGKVLRSTDCVEWAMVTTSIIPRPTWGDSMVKGTPVIWAPDCVKIGSQWVYYYSLASWGEEACGIGVAVADEIAGPYTDLGKLFSIHDGIEINGNIDPCIIQDDGHIYICVGSFHGNYLLELSSDGTELIQGDDFATANKEKTLIAGKYMSEFDNRYYEGSYIIKKGEYFYYFGSAGSCCDNKKSSYTVYVARSKSVFGPYVDNNNFEILGDNYGKTKGRLVIMGNSANEGGTAGPGHNSIFIDDAGDYWIIYHAYDAESGYATRHLFMDKLSWDDQGFPYVVGVKPTIVEQNGPRLL